MRPFSSTYANNLLVFFLLGTASLPTKTLAQDIQSPWRNFSRFLDLEKGGVVPGISQLKRYFVRFGYLSFDEVLDNEVDTFDTALESAVVSYQKNLGLPVTGKIDFETLREIMSPRCGLGDSREVQAAGRFAYFAGQPRWRKKAPITLTYAFSGAHTIHSLRPGEIRQVFRRAFSRWSTVIPVNFTETPELGAADVKIGFYRGVHGDGEPFDGVLGVLGHAFSPENGRLHLDGAETWAVDLAKQKSSVAVDLESVVMHEVGHVLGLAHSSVKEAVMYPNLRPRTRKVELRIDDVEGVQALYGSNPNFKLSSLLASLASSDVASDLTVRWRSLFVPSTLVVGFFLSV